MAKIKKDDEVIVLTGRDKGKKGKVVKVLPSQGKAIVQNVNMVKKHQRLTQTTQAGIIPKEMPIQLSNLAIVDPKEGRATKVGYKFLEDGTKVRFAKLSGEVLS